MSEANWYGEVFKGWQSKLLGSKPTAEMLANIHKLGARPGKQALANAMALRPEGVTGSQIIIACGAPQLNKMRGFIADALLKRLPASPSPQGHQVYKLEVTAKGLQRIAKAEKLINDAATAAAGAVDKAVKSAGKAKAKPKVKKAAKGEPVETPTTDPHSMAENDVIMQNEAGRIVHAAETPHYDDGE